MAVKETPARYKGFTFDGVDSKDYGVYIQDGGMFDAPARDVEMVEIPGRNGAYALDKGRFENVTLTYQAFIPQDSETDFATAIRDFRNQLASRKGYCRLEDEFNADEYRLAVFKDGLTIDNVSPKVGTFDITFDCKPQRYLTSGETAITVASGDTITNPTLFEAQPLLSVTGYGELTINGVVTGVLDQPIGNVELVQATQTIRGETDGVSGSVSKTTTPDYAPLVLGDTVTISNSEWDNYSALIRINFYKPGSGGSATYADTATWTTDGGLNATISNPYPNPAYLLIKLPPLVYQSGTAKSRTEETIRVTATKDSSTCVFTVIVGWQATANNVVIDMTATRQSGTTLEMNNLALQVGPFIGYSTYSANENPILIDMDIGEAYTYVDGEKVSYNSNVILPGMLPTLEPGDNAVTYPNTISNLEIVPRWWRV